ncbi:MAG: hypothetical protein IID39_01210 [Planctomycetes bacterium]|nr:hypothetical protein [Planctomycetota bacterium]
MNPPLLIVLSLLVALAPGCALEEVRSKTKFGPEFRHKGSNRTNAVRWTAQQGFDFKWDKGISTGITYRRRDTDEGSGDNDNGVWIDISFPIWQAPEKADAMARRVERLERRLARLESQPRD